jgi:hypothetical protein
MPIEYKDTRLLLDRIFREAEANLLLGSPPEVNQAFHKAVDALFSSHTQAYREVLLGCVLARIRDQNINIRMPYSKQGSAAFNGRSLDENVVNPFLQEKRIPSSRGPYLSVFRRNIQFDSTIRSGLKDKEGYDAFLTVITYLESTNNIPDLEVYLKYMLYRFLELREASIISLAKLSRMSLSQYDALISGLLETPSGGRFPVLLVVATLNAIKYYFHLDWQVDSQGINVADTASGAGGDITVTSSGVIVMAAEVTERPVDKSRIVATFNTKIAPKGIEDYLFFVKASTIAVDAKQQAHQYFAQGHEMNFLEVKNWMLMILATLGKNGRADFNKILIALLDTSDTPRTMKVAWNDQVNKLLSG